MEATFKSYAKRKEGRTIALLLLFAVALLSFVSAGITGYAAVCMLPLLVVLVLLALRFKLFLFTVLMVVNYFLMFAARSGWLFLPVSLHTEVIEIALIAVAIIDAREMHAANIFNMMLVMVLAWVTFCVIEIFNDSCGIGIDLYAWYTGARLMAFQILYAFIVCAIYVNSPKRVFYFIFLWAAMALFAVFWIWKQQKIGLNAEEAFFVANSKSHMVNGHIRYFSIFSDAANCGCHMAGAAIVFLILAITNRIRVLRAVFLVTGLLCVWCFFCTGTRTALVCFIAGMGVYTVLSKSVKIVVPFCVALALFVSFLAFTNIGNSNYNIRRMRSAFRADDASLNVRDINKQALAKYMRDAPWGIGIGIEQDDVPPYNKFKIVTQIPPDSEYVYIWVRTGRIGITLFVVTTLVMLGLACWTVLFRIKNASLRGIGAAFTCAFVAIQLGGYANQILMQFPNVLMFYGGLTIVFLLPNIEGEYAAFERELLDRQEKRREARLAKKRTARV